MAYQHKLTDRFTSHAINVEQFSAGLSTRVLAQLRKLEGDLTRQLRHAEFDAPRLAWDVRVRKSRLEALLKQTRETIKVNFGRIEKYTGHQLRSFAELEDVATRSFINGIAPIEIASVALSSEQLDAIMSDALIDGRTQRQLWKRQSATVTRRFENTVRLGLLEGKPTDEIVNDLRKSGFKLAEVQTDALVRTSIASVSNKARLAVYAENSDVIDYIMQLSVLDTRTTDICKAYSNKRWTVGTHEPVGHKLPFNGGVPRHWRCRSTIIPVIKSFESLAGLSKARGIGAEREGFDFRKNLRERGFTRGEAAAIERHAQASMTGEVSESLDYEAWLKRQKKSTQIAALGEDKYALWNDGKLTFEQLVDQRGNPLSLEQLQDVVTRPQRAAMAAAKQGKPLYMGDVGDYALYAKTSNPEGLQALEQMYAYAADIESDDYRFLRNAITEASERQAAAGINPRIFKEYPLATLEYEVPVSGTELGRYDFFRGIPERKQTYGMMHVFDSQRMAETVLHETGHHFHISYLRATGGDVEMAKAVSADWERLRPMIEKKIGAPLKGNWGAIPDSMLTRIPSQYAMKSKDEFFAEAYRLYAQNENTRKFLKKVAPETYKFLDEAKTGVHLEKFLAGELQPQPIWVGEYNGVSGRRLESLNLSARAKRATETYKPVTSEKIKRSDANVRKIAEDMWGERTPDNHPMDVLVPDMKMGIEVKTIIEAANSKITMHKDSLARKFKWIQTNHYKRGFTVAVDERSGEKIWYIRKGFGSFNLENMQRVTYKQLIKILTGAK